MMEQLFGIDNYFYHGSIRRYVALFGSLFSDLHIQRKTDTKEDYIKIPIRYGNGNMYMKAPQDVQNREMQQIARVLPGMAFELSNFYKDVHRKTNPMNRLQHPTFETDTVIAKPSNYNRDLKKFQFNRVPYNFVFELVIRTKNTDDMLQITEQIIPAFDGNLSVTINDTTGVPIEQDIIIVLQEVKMEDNYDQEMQSRLVEYTITFELKGYLYKRTITGLTVSSVDIQEGDFYDTMTTVQTVDATAGDLHVEQVNLSKMNAALDGLASTPIQKVTRKNRKG